MKLFFHSIVLLASLSAIAMEQNLPLSPTMVRANALPASSEILELIVPPEHKFKMIGLHNLIASREWRRTSNSDLSSSWGSTSKRSSSNQDPLLTKIIDLSNEIAELQERALAPSISNYSFLKKDSFIIKFSDLQGKNLLHRAMENKNSSLVSYLLQYQADLLQQPDDKGKKPTDYIDPLDTPLLIILSNHITGLESITLEGSPKSPSLLTNAK